MVAVVVDDDGGGWFNLSPLYGLFYIIIILLFQIYIAHQREFTLVIINEKITHVHVIQLCNRSSTTLTCI